MKIKNIRLPEFKDLLAVSVRNLSWLFFAIFVCLLVFEGLELKHSVDIIISANQDPIVTNRPQGVRINFDDYNKVVLRIDQSRTFEPATTTLDDPFVLTK